MDREVDMAESEHRHKQLLDPVDRISEILFGLIMVLTFTCSLSAGTLDRKEVHAILVGAIGCNLAWGVVDAVMYLMSSLTERARNRRMLTTIRRASSPDEAHRVIRDVLPPILLSNLEAAQVEKWRVQLLEKPEPAGGPRLHTEDWAGALAVCALVFASTFPVVLPFFFIHDPVAALRLSNGIAIVLLFFCGLSLGRYAGDPRPWWSGLWMVAVSLALVAITMALGG